jgi:hypothetical protein
MIASLSNLHFPYNKGQLYEMWLAQTDQNWLYYAAENITTDHFKQCPMYLTVYIFKQF